MSTDLSNVLNDAGSVTIEQYAFGTALVELLLSTRSQAEFITAAMPNLTLQQVRFYAHNIILPYNPCFPPTFLAILQYLSLSELYSDFTGHESALDEVLHRIRGDGLDPNMPLGRLQAMQKHLSRAASTHVKRVVPTPSRAVCLAHATSLTHGLSLLKANLLRFAQVFERNLSFDSSFGPALARLKDYAAQAEAIQPHCRKILRSLPQANAENTIVVPDEKLEAMEQAVSQVRDTAFALASAVEASLAHIHGSLTLRTLDLTTALQLAVNSHIDVTDAGEALATARAAGADESMLPFHIKGVIKASQELLSDFADKLAAGVFDAKGEKHAGQAT